MLGMDHHAGPDTASEQPWELERLTRCRRNHAEGAPPFPLDLARSRLPYAVAWCPLPGITSFLPVVGHMGIADSRGVIMDFAGPYCIGVDQMSFSKPYLYYQLDPALVRKRAPGQSLAAAWDAGVDSGSTEYLSRMHNSSYRAACLAARCTLLVPSSMCAPLSPPLHPLLQSAATIATATWRGA